MAKSPPWRHAAVTRRSSSPALPIPEQLVVIQSSEKFPREPHSMFGMQPLNCTFGITRRAGRLGRLPRPPAFPVKVPGNREALAAGSGLSLPPAAGHKRGGGEGDDGVEHTGSNIPEQEVLFLPRCLRGFLVCIAFCAPTATLWVFSILTPCLRTLHCKQA